MSIGRDTIKVVTQMKYKYCKIHNQKYDINLTACPVCEGEKMGGTLIKRIYTKGQKGYESATKETTKPASDNTSSSGEESG